MLTTFIYGDTLSLALCLISVYFMMKYEENYKTRYFIYSLLAIIFAYMFRMNSLIFIIGTVIYMILNVVYNLKKDSYKKNGLQILVILIYIIISIMPTTIIKNYYINKFGMDKEKSYPTISYILIGMEKSWRANGWYNEKIAQKAISNPEIVKEEYIVKIKDRLKYFMHNLDYTFSFYTNKLASMWTENTYSAIRNNIGKNNKKINNWIFNLTLYQKAVLILICICSIIVLIQNRKNLSLELIFLISIFVGGFSFYVFWEAKSRYIIPYIVVLMPVASICINTKGVHRVLVNKCMLRKNDMD